MGYTRVKYSLLTYVLMCGEEKRLTFCLAFLLDAKLCDVPTEGPAQECSPISPLSADMTSESWEVRNQGFSLTRLKQEVKKRQATPAAVVAQGGPHWSRAM